MSPEPRHVALAIVFSPRTKKILMVTSRKHSNMWILPKGGIEKGENSLEAAIRESSEEAGTPKVVQGGNEEPLITINLDPASGKKKGAMWFVHVVEVDEGQVGPDADWLESEERQRGWVSPAECLDRIRAWYKDPKLQDEVTLDSAIEDPAGRLKGSKREQKGGAMELALQAFLDTLDRTGGTS